MYDALTPLFDKVTDADLRSDFKSEAFNRLGTDGPGKPESVPRKGVKIVRDKFNVPHVTATTHDGGVWAAGWIAAEDRALLLEQARFNARDRGDRRARDSRRCDLITSLRSFVPSAQTEAAVAAEVGVLRAAGRKGRARAARHRHVPQGDQRQLQRRREQRAAVDPQRPISLIALKGQFLGQGGGDEARRTQFLAGLQARLGAEPGLAVFNDLRQHDDPEAPATIERRAPYAPTARQPRRQRDHRPGQLHPHAGRDACPAAARGGARAAQASNVLIVAAKHSATKRPLFVGGPQIGYYYPGLTCEIDMNAPGLHWRGATSVPFPGYMLIGRGADFATCSPRPSGDIIDQYAETLCGGSDTKYVYKGTCRDMGVFDAGVLKGTGGAPDQQVKFNTTVHGPVSATRRSTA